MPWGTKNGKKKGRPKGSKNKPKVLAPSMKKAIVKLVKGQIETKYTQDASSLSNVTFNSAPNSNADAFFVLSNITQGVGSNQRIGDSISDVKVSVKGYISVNNPNFNSPTGARLYAVRLMLLRCKTLPIAVTNLPWTSLLRGNASYNGFTGAGINLFQPINRVDFEVFGDKIITLNSSFSSTATQSFSGLIHPNNMFHMTATHKGKIEYEDGTNLIKWNPFFCLGYIFEDGTGTIDTVTTNIISCGIFESWFKDA